VLKEIIYWGQNWLGFAEKFLQSNNDSVKQLLSATTFYVFPNVSPDAMEQFFAPIRYERTGNSSTTDDDRDGKVNEDGYDDIDGNGKITMMRVESPIGEYKISAEDPRSMVKADLSKGEKGSYILYTEGKDNDKDGFYNEDGRVELLSIKIYPSSTPPLPRVQVSLLFRNRNQEHC
jgi:hypothetical protein